MPTTGVYIGRFQPFHNGHRHVINEALKQVDRLIVLVGSADEPRSLKNPFTFAERREMIHAGLSPDCATKVFVKPLWDETYDTPLWEQRVRDTVKSKDKVVLIGHSKDETSYYLRDFPDFGLIEVSNYEGINATDIRNDMFEFKVNFDTVPMPPLSANLMAIFQTQQWFIELAKEHQFIKSYRAGWARVPYPVNFVCTDALVTHGEHILLVERKEAPGKGLWAMPGGFLNVDETIEQGTLRELKEETGLVLPDFDTYLAGHQVFDAPKRSMRGRIITHCTHFDVSQDHEFGAPELVAGDDAAKAEWVPIVSLRRDRMFNDHFHIIHAMLKDR